MLQRMRLARHVACTEARNARRVVVGKPYGKRPSEWIILKWILEKLNGVVRTGFIWLRIGWSCEHGNEHSCSIKC
jgi:hypothetical protein